jgi:hypothetical protein
VPTWPISIRARSGLLDILQMGRIYMHCVYMDMSLSVLCFFLNLQVKEIRILSDTRSQVIDGSNQNLCITGCKLSQVTYTIHHGRDSDAHRSVVMVDSYYNISQLTSTCRTTHLTNLDEDDRSSVEQADKGQDGANNIRT